MIPANLIAQYVSHIYKTTLFPSASVWDFGTPVIVYLEFIINYW